MTPDQIMAVPICVSIALLLVNVRALIRDGRAYGVRPHLSIWIFFSNAVMASQMFQIQQFWTAAVLALYGSASVVNAGLISYYRRRQRS